MGDVDAHDDFRRGGAARTRRRGEQVVGVECVAETCIDVRLDARRPAGSRRRSSRPARTSGSRSAVRTPAARGTGTRRAPTPRDRSAPPPCGRGSSRRARGRTSASGRTDRALRTHPTRGRSAKTVGHDDACRTTVRRGVLDDAHRRGRRARRRASGRRLPPAIAAAPGRRRRVARQVRASA